MELGGAPARRDRPLRGRLPGTWRVAFRVTSSASAIPGDGTDEIVLGAWGQDGGDYYTGAAYLLYGSTTQRSGAVSASTADATIQGLAADDYLGHAVGFVSDMDGDGLDELLVGAYGAGSAGEAYLFLGSTTPLSGVSAASTADMTYSGVGSAAGAGYGVYDLTDITGDGYVDAGVYGYSYHGGGISIGGLWVFAGGTTLSSTAVATLYGDADYETPRATARPRSTGSCPR